ncbi:MAG: hypothetical protein SNH94_01370 [Rikenellaceae bacterium]
MDSNKFMQQKLSDWQRLEGVIAWANMTTNYFARYIGLARGENLYQIKRGNNSISRKIAAMITETFPEISLLWLLTGDGEMLTDLENRGAIKPLYNIGVEQAIRQVESLEPSEEIMLPSCIDYDIAMRYLGRAMGDITPTNTIVLLKKILPEEIIPGDECVIVTKKIVLLRIVTIEDGDNNNTILRLIAADNQNLGSVKIELDQVEAAYKVKAKILTNI